MSDEDFSRKSFPWMRAGFDLEGYVGALAAWLVGILMGIVWGPLFWLGFFAAIVILFATDQRVIAAAPFKPVAPARAHQNIVAL